MTTASYERYGLTGNPFRDLASENLADVPFFHVSLAIDASLRSIREETLEKENRALVAIVGEQGAGKTQRLRLAHAEALERKALSAYVDVPAQGTALVVAIARAIGEAAKESRRTGWFRAPRSARALAQLATTRATTIDPSPAGRTIGQALNDDAPAFLLLNDLHHLTAPPQAALVARLLEEISDAIRPGVALIFGAYPAYLAALEKARPSFASRINRTFSIPTLQDEEASLLLAKKLLAKRLVEDLDPLYPFDRESVARLNEAAAGNPRRLLELADSALEIAVGQRSYRVDRDLVAATLAQRAGPPARPPPAAPLGASRPAATGPSRPGRAPPQGSVEPSASS